MDPELGDLIDEIMKRKKWVQQDLADYIGVQQPAVSKMRKSDEWSYHWRVFMRLLPLMIALKIVRQEELRISDNETGHEKARKIEENCRKRQKRNIMSTSPNILVFSH